MVGYDREDLVSQSVRWTDMTPPEWRERDQQQLVPELKMTGSLQPFEKEFFRKDGSRVPVLIGVANFEDGGYQGVAFVLDLTERKRAADALRALQMDLAHANRLATMGQLAASIAHEVNQPIGAARNNAHAALRFLAARPAGPRGSQGGARVRGERHLSSGRHHRPDPRSDQESAVRARKAST